MSLALWLVIYLLVTFLVGRLYEVSLGWRTAGLIFYPGMLVAAAGRLLACLVGQQEKGKVDLMRGGGPSGARESLPGGHVFRFLWAVGPFLSTLLVFVFAWHFLERPLGFSGRLPQLDLDFDAVGESASTLSTFLRAIVGAVGEQRLGDWRWWVFLYLGFALVVASAPSKDDLASVTIFSAALGAICLLLGQLGVDVVARGVYGGSFWSGFSFLLAMSLLVLAASGLVLLPFKFLRSSGDKK